MLTKFTKGGNWGDTDTFVKTHYLVIPRPTPKNMRKYPVGKKAYHWKGNNIRCSGIHRSYDKNRIIK